MRIILILLAGEIFSFRLASPFFSKLVGGRFISFGPETNELLPSSAPYLKDLNVHFILTFHIF